MAKGQGMRTFVAIAAMGVAAVIATACGGGSSPKAATKPKHTAATTTSTTTIPVERVALTGTVALPWISEPGQPNVGDMTKTPWSFTTDPAQPASLDICAGVGDYTAIKGGAEVTVTNETGASVGTGLLGDGVANIAADQQSWGPCTFHFLVMVPKNAATYRVNLGFRHVDFTAQELAAKSWVAALVFGPGDGQPPPPPDSGWIANATTCPPLSPSTWPADHQSECEEFVQRYEAGQAQQESQQADENWNAVQTGMTLAQVQRIYGSDGSVDSTASVGGYTDEIRSFSGVLITFGNGRVVAKTRVP